jgi:hypothetical protein
MVMIRTWRTYQVRLDLPIEIKRKKEKKLVFSLFSKDLFKPRRTVTGLLIKGINFKTISIAADTLF